MTELLEGFNWAATATDLDGEYVRSSVSPGVASGRNGNGISISPAADRWLERPLASTHATYVSGVAFNRNTAVNTTGIFQWRSAAAADILWLGVNNSGALELRRGAFNGTLLDTGPTIGVTWVYVELRATIHASTGAYEVVVDDTVVLSATGVNTGSANVAAVRLADGNGVAGTALYDDLYLDDADLLGDMSIGTYAMFEDQSPMDLAPSSGGDVFAVTDEIPNNGDTDYGSFDTDGQRGVFGVTDPSLSSVSIVGVMATVVARQESSGSHGIIIGAGAGGNITDSAKRSLATTYRGRHGIVLPLNPDTSLPFVAGDFASGNVQVAVEYAA